MHSKKLPLFAVLSLIVAIVLTACSSATEVPPTQEPEQCPTLPAPEVCRHEEETFCANENCHGRSWPEVNLSVATPPFPLP